MATDYKTTISILRLIQRLERTHGRALPTNKLAQEFAVHRRTLTRWVLALADAVEPGEDPPLHREIRAGVSWMVRPQTEPPITGTLFQYAAAYAATLHLRPGGSLVNVLADQAVSRIEGGLPIRERQLVERINQAFHYVPFAPKVFDPDDEVLDVLLRGLLKRRIVDVMYDGMNGNKPKELRLAPITLVMYREAFYLLAHIAFGTLSKPHLFAVDRIDSAELHPARTFEPAKDFDVSSWFDGHMGVWRSESPAERVEVAFSSTAAKLVRERRWPGFQELIDLPDGRVKLVMSLPITPEVTSWVLGWGAQAEIIAPASLRDEVGQALQAAAQRYL